MSVVISVLSAVLRLTVPIIFMEVGNIFSERAGIMNLGAEGMMTSGAFCAILGAHFSGNPWIGVLCGMLGGILVASVHSVNCVEFGGNQNISGLGLNTLAVGLAGFLCRRIFGSALSAKIRCLDTTPVLKGIPFIEDMTNEMEQWFRRYSIEENDGRQYPVNGEGQINLAPLWHSGEVVFKSVDGRIIYKEES